MMYIVVLFFLFFSSSAYSLDIDIESFKKEIQNDPTNISARLVLAQDYIRKENFAEAEITLNQVLEIEKNNKKANAMMEKIKKHQKVDEKKVEVKDETLSRAKMLEEIYQNSHSFSDFKNYYYEVEGLDQKELGFAKLENFVADHSHDEEAVLFLANQYYWNKNTTQSLHVISHVIDETKNIGILTLYANILYESGKRKKALPYFKRVVKLGGNSSEIKKRIKFAKSNKRAHKSNKKALSSKNRAEKYFAKKEYLKSIKYYKSYFKRVSNDSNVRFHYATALENLRQYKQAEKQYRIVSQQIDKLYELSTYRYARVMIAQRDEVKWDRARTVLENLLDTLVNKEPTKERDDILKYTQQSLATVSEPMPTATMHKDVYLTAEQSKILDQPTFSANSIENREISSVKSMLNPRFSALVSDTDIDIDIDIDATLFVSFFDDESINNNSFGLKVGNESISIEVKKSNFKNSEGNKTKKLNANSIRAAYNNGDNFSMSLGVNSFEDATNVVGKLEYSQATNNHNITYGLEYQNGVFTNGATCMIENDINVISLSLYDIILMDNLEQTELMVTLNSFSDGNINLNSWTNYPILRMVNESFENSLSIVGNYEYNSKKDTCYYASDFFDSTQLELKSKYQFTNGGYIEMMGSVGYSLKNAKVLYSYGLILQLSNISVNCRHYQSGYSPDGANECYASFTRVW